MALVSQSLERMIDVSRTAWESFIRCKRCFYLERKLKIKSIGMPGYPINSRIDALLKVEFDIYREKEEPHPIFKKNNLNFVPFKMDMEKLNNFRNIPILNISAKNGNGIDDLLNLIQKNILKNKELMNRLKNLLKIQLPKTKCLNLLKDCH